MANAAEDKAPRVFMGPASAAARLAPLRAALAELSADCSAPVEVIAAPGQGGCALIVWLHDPDAQPASDELRWLDARAAAGVPILPLVERLADAGSLPASISALNAMPLDRYGAAERVAVADEIAGRLWLRRRQRKAFISYRRCDSAAIAMQLNTALVAQRWSVFLDDHEIDWGEDFQRELMWALNDVDLVILLASPQSMTSKWLLQEVAVALSRSIGLLPITWPASQGAVPVYVQNLDLHSAVALESGHFVDPSAAPGVHTLTPSALESIQAAAYAERARAVVERSRSYVFDARQRLVRSAKAKSVRPTTTHGEFDCDLPTADGVRPTRVRYLPFRPTAVDLFDAQAEAEARDGSTVCIYPENDADDERAKALRWCAGAHPASRVELWAHNRRGFRMGVDP